jgi:hypothetical protein
MAQKRLPSRSRDTCDWSKEFLLISNFTVKKKDLFRFLFFADESFRNVTTPLNVRRFILLAMVKIFGLVYEICQHAQTRNWCTLRGLLRGYYCSPEPTSTYGEKSKAEKISFVSAVKFSCSTVHTFPTSVPVFQDVSSRTPKPKQELTKRRFDSCAYCHSPDHHSTGCPDPKCKSSTQNSRGRLDASPSGDDQVRAQT